MNLHMQYDTLGPVLATRAMMCLALISGLAAWGLSIGALLVHKPKILFPAAVAYGLQGEEGQSPGGACSTHYLHTGCYQGSNLFPCAGFCFMNNNYLFRESALLELL